MSDRQTITGSSSRIDMVDAIRGFALMGLFLVHSVEVFELHWADPVSSPVFDTIFMLFGGKAYALFALSFGLSFSLIMEGAAKRGESYELRFAWRLVLLLGFGIFHTLIYRGDILVVLASLGFVLLPLHKIKDTRWIFAIGAIFILNPVHLFRVWAGIQGADWAIAQPNYYTDNAMQAMLGTDLGKVLLANIGPGNELRWWYTIESGRLTQIIGLFSIGMGLGRIGFFKDWARFKTHTLIAFFIFSIAAFGLYSVQPILVGYVGQSLEGFGSVYANNLVKAWADFSFMAAQLCGFILLWHLTRDTLFAPIQSALVPAGRMTLTMYIGQSLLFVPIYYPFGLGLYGQLTHMQLLMIGVVSFIIQLGLAFQWMKHFNYGPLEWLWRASTKMDFSLPLRRQRLAVDLGSLPKINP